MEFIHKTVLLNEAIDGLNCSAGKIYIDATVGGGGHSVEIAKKIGSEGNLLAFDVDEDAIKASTEKLQNFQNIKIIKSSYTQIPVILKELGIEKITGGILFDLGASYHQLTTQERGFSFTKEAFLDMRFNQDCPNKDLSKNQKSRGLIKGSGSHLTAYEIINKYTESALADIFFKYGEERFSRRIAKKIVEKRKEKPIETTTELADIIKASVPFSKLNIHPATRVFQALRIAVNKELDVIETTLQQIIHLLDKDARIVVISFHSLEDRLVKNIFKKYSSDCECPPEQIICSCEPKQLKILTKKPLIPSSKELKDNPSARSAKMRIAEKIR
jgi:16S rRNA (cytosine1402-N4)-methyltransferase